jgi:hypothetical protein
MARGKKVEPHVASLIGSIWMLAVSHARKSLKSWI